MHLCMDTGCGILPAPAWVSEIVRHAMGPGFLSVGKTARPPVAAKPRPSAGPWRGNSSLDNLRYAQAANVRRAQEEAGKSPAGPIAANAGPAASPRDVIVIWRKQEGGRTRDVVMSTRDGTISMRPEVADRMMAEIRCNHPNAEFVVLRDLHQFGGARLDRSVAIPIMRATPWP